MTAGPGVTPWAVWKPAEVIWPLDQPFLGVSVAYIAASERFYGYYWSFLRPGLFESKGESGEELYETAGVEPGRSEPEREPEGSY